MMDQVNSGNRRFNPMTAELRDAVTAFDAATPREIASRARFLAELDRLADPFNRDADPVHVTGSAILTGPRGTVLHWHKRMGGWMQPGGHIDAGETPWAAALRETQEETGIAVRHPSDGPRLLHLDAHPAGPHFHLDLRYLLLSGDDDPAPPPGEPAGPVVHACRGDGRRRRCAYRRPASAPGIPRFHRRRLSATPRPGPPCCRARSGTRPPSGFLPAQPQPAAEGVQ